MSKHPDEKSVELTIQPAISIPEYLTGEIRSKLAYVDEQIADANVTTDTITLNLRTAIDMDAQKTIEEKVQKVVISMAKGAFKLKVEVLEDYTNRPVPYNLDPTPELIARGELSQEGPGMYTAGPLLTRLIDFFESRFLGLADSFDAKPYRFPTLISAKQLDRVNYFHAFPHSLTFATHLREDLDVIENFAEHAHCDEHGLVAPEGSFDQIEALLSPAVCYHLYFALADKPLPNGKLIATAVGNCFRYEAINLISLERMWNFTMREVIFVGPKEFVLENREIARKRMTKTFEEIGLAYRVESANDPFFIGEFRKQTAFQSAFQLKYEIRANLPFKNTSLAVGSYNYHQDFFGRNMNITLPDGSPTHTGCVAFGLERMAYAFLSQYGFDLERWPKAVKDNFQ